MTSLTIVVFTVNGAEKLARIIPPLLGIADQLVIGVDDSSSDASYDVARTYTDHVVSVPHAAFSTPYWAIAFILPYCTGDWILRVDHDETLSPHWSDRRYVQDLISNRDATHIWIPRRWLIPPGDRYISSYPWQPDYQIRLFRNIPSLLHLSSEQHGEDIVIGESFFVTDSWIAHWDLVWHDRQTREDKVRFYESQPGETGAEHYLYEDDAYESKPIDWAPSLPADFVWTDSTRLELPASAFHASLRIVDIPVNLHAQSRATLILAVRNDSTRSFDLGNGWSLIPNVLASYHWRADGVDAEAREFPRTPLPRRLGPGTSVLMFLVVQCPREPGRYVLQPDLVEEHLGWFSEHCTIEPIDVVVQPAILATSAVS